MNLSAKDIERFWSKVDVRGDEECWLWKPRSNSNGYGQFFMRYDGKDYQTLPHRISWQIANGREPREGYFVCHKPIICHNRLCCNPSHLDEKTPKENNADQYIDGTVQIGDKHWANRYPEKYHRGDNHYSRTKPELLARGESHGLVAHPEKAARGDRNGKHTHPEKIQRGDDHPSRKHPELVKRGEQHPNAKMTEADVITAKEMWATKKFTGKEIADTLGRKLCTIYAVLSGRNWKEVNPKEEAK